MSYSDQYEIKRQRWGTYISYTTEGKELVTSMEESHCRQATEQLLYWMEHGFPETETTHESTVGGKL